MEFWEFTTEFDVEKAPCPYRKRTKCVQINAAYKTKDKKVQPVDEADGIGNTPGGKRD